MDILVTVEGQKMKLASNQTHHIEGSSQFVKFIFNLSDEWSGLDSNVQFIQNGEAYGQKLDGSGNKKYAFLPNGITEGECKMVLYGGDGTIRATTNYIPLSIGKDISALSTLSENISRTDYERALVELKQFVANGGVTEIALNQAFSNAVNEIATEENVKQEIASGITIAKSEIESAKASIENAKTEISNSVATVKESEEKTKEYANGVQEIINSAETIKNEANEALVNANEALSNANTALATAKDAIEARDEIIGKTGSAKSPEPKSALGEIRQARKDILGDDGAEGIVETVTALKNQAEAAKGEAVQSAEAAATSEKNVKAIESKIDQANNSAAQIESFRTEMTTAHTAVINARNDILAKGDDKKSVYDKIIDAKTSINSSKDLIIGSDGLIIGSDGTVTAPGKGSALDKVQKAQAAAEAAQEAAVQARNEAEGFAASANKGITVINSLDSTDTANALSANQGRVLNEKIANLNEIYIMKSGETEADVPKSVEIIIMPEESGTPYVLTDSDKAEIASLVNNATIVQAPIYVDSIDKMTDTSRVYVLSSTGDIWAYMDTTVTKEITDKITGTTENPYLNGNRLGSDGSAVNDSSEMVLTPYIDIGSYTTYGSITLKLAGIQYIFPSHKTNVKVALYDENKAKIACAESCLDGTYGIGGVIGFAIAEDNSATVTLNLPYSYSGKVVKYMRFNTIGTSEASDISIIYTGEVTGSQWVNTNLKYSPVITDDEKTSIAEQAAALIDTNLLDLIGDEEVVV